MGLFGKLLEKKTCDICGREIRILENRRLEDGNCCRQCASGLSPWFSERRSATVDEIRAQLAYRRANREKAASFRVSRVLGNDMKVLLDEEAGTFMVTRAIDLGEENPDVLTLGQVTGCELEIREEEDTICPPSSGEGPSWGYEFIVHIRVRHPYFDSMDVELSNGSIDVEGKCKEGAAVPPTPGERRRNPEYARAEALAEEIRRALLPAGESTGERTESGQGVLCPWCGAVTKKTENGRCAFCGGSLQG